MLSLTLSVVSMATFASVAEDAKELLDVFIKPSGADGLRGNEKLSYISSVKAAWKEAAAAARNTNEGGKDEEREEPDPVSGD